ncbi:hypothetical protein NB640_01965 [Oxalobacter vibrioformis]|uniref:Uncharacterized protein n=1 Tax=Oxalobacter vibrioformis TaxID=933080 RepID=A0A9E9LZD9_9BURK|nr:hypothetical protein [Oxalobacter vibrioformis]WAW10450.1 hypothetical protein NB640_01965 [Oxalobacter vibrioformis]
MKFFMYFHICALQSHNRKRKKQENNTPSAQQDDGWKSKTGDLATARMGRQ